MVKICTGCGADKELEEFCTDKRAKDGRQSRCKECGKASYKEYYEANKESTLVKQKAFREANPRKRAAQQKSWQQTNPEKMRANNQRRRARLEDIPGKFTSQELDWMFQAADNKCLCCGISGDEVTLAADHIIPVDWGAEAGCTNYIYNIQPLCQPCNSAKKNHHDTDYRTEEYFQRYESLSGETI